MLLHRERHGGSSLSGANDQRAARWRLWKVGWQYPGRIRGAERSLKAAGQEIHRRKRFIHGLGPMPIILSTAPCNAPAGWQNSSRIE